MKYLSKYSLLSTFLILITSSTYAQKENKINPWIETGMSNTLMLFPEVEDALFRSDYQPELSWNFALGAEVEVLKFWDINLGVDYTALRYSYNECPVRPIQYCFIYYAGNEFPKITYTQNRLGLNIGQAFKVKISQNHFLKLRTNYILSNRVNIRANLDRDYDFKIKDHYPTDNIDPIKVFVHTFRGGLFYEHKLGFEFGAFIQRDVYAPTKIYEKPDTENSNSFAKFLNIGASLRFYPFVIYSQLFRKE